MPDDTPPLPQGYKIEEATPPLPQGYSLESGMAGATSLTAPPKPFSSAWFKEKADRASDYLGAAGATVGGIVGAAGGPVGSIAGATLGGGAGEAARQLTQRALGTNYNVPETSGQAALQIGKEGAIQGTMTGATEGLTSLARLGSPALAESSLGVGAAMRGRGRTIGKAVLENTSGIGPKAVSESAAEVVDSLTNELEKRVNAATVQGKQGSTQAAHQMLDDLISKIPRNAPEVRGKLESLRETLNFRGNTPSPQKTFTPNELLEMKRGIGKTIDVWPPEWKYNKDVIRAKMQLYGIIDKEVDKLAPGTDAINQQISSLIPAIKQGAKEADQAGLAQNLAHRLGAHTGALAGAGIGGAFGYQKGGTEGAVLGSTIGLVAPELISSPQAQMLGARTLFNLRRAKVPISALGGGLADYLRKPDRGQDND